MALDPRTQMAQTQFQECEHSPSRTPLPAEPAHPEKTDRRQGTAKRRKLHALTEALFDPFTTIAEADLEALMLVATRRTPRKRPRS